MTKIKVGFFTLLLIVAALVVVPRLTSEEKPPRNLPRPVEIDPNKEEKYIITATFKPSPRTQSILIDFQRNDIMHKPVRIGEPKRSPFDYEVTVPQGTTIGAWAEQFQNGELILSCTHVGSGSQRVFRLTTVGEARCFHGA